MKITAVRTRIVPVGFRNGLYTFIETDEGITGVSEVMMRRKNRTVETHIGELARFLVGRDPTAVEDNFEKMYRDSFWVGGTLHAAALSAVDIAMWDIRGKAFNLPVYRLLGGPCRQEVLVYCHVPGGNRPEEFAANALEAKQRGFKAFKTTIPLFYGMDKSIEGYSGWSSERYRRLKETEYLPTGFLRHIGRFFAAARQAVGEEMEIALDCHGRLNCATAVRLCDILAPYDLMFVEEPVPPENEDALDFVIQHSPIPIASGERLATIYDARRFLAKPGLAMLQCDVVDCGGITAMKKIAAMAEAAYVSMAPHNPNGPLCTAASVQICGAIPNFSILETIGSIDDANVSRRILRNPLEIVEGAIRLPQGPGLGVEIDEEFFAQDHPYRPIDSWR